MTSIFQRIFGKTSKEDSAFPSNSGRGQHSSIHAGSENATRAQLVQVVMRDLLRKSGIPPGWIICQPQALNSTSRGPGIFVRLSVKHWDPRLMQYAFAFQKALLTDIVRFEPKAITWLHGIAWQLEVASTCPHTVLPDKDFWLEAPMAMPTRQSLAARPYVATPVTAQAPMTSPLSSPANSPVSAVAPKPPAPYKPAVHLDQPENDAAQDLKRLFAIRDKELANHASDGFLPAGYESTAPSPLRAN